jgi:hypothetical protein
MRVIDIVVSKIENVEKILQINCTATDFYNSEFFPTFLYYNPYDTLKEVCFYQADKSKTDLYDALHDEYLVRDAGEESCFGIQGKSSRLLVVLSSGSKLKMEDGKYFADNTIISYRPPNKR